MHDIPRFRAHGASDGGVPAAHAIIEQATAAIIPRPGAVAQIFRLYPKTAAATHEETVYRAAVTKE